METICVTYGTDGTDRTDIRTDSGDTICSPTPTSPPHPPPRLKMAGHKKQKNHGPRFPHWITTDKNIYCISANAMQLLPVLPQQ